MWWAIKKLLAMLTLIIVYILVCVNDRIFCDGNMHGMSEASWCWLHPWQHYEPGYLLWFVTITL